MAGSQAASLSACLPRECRMPGPGPGICVLQALQVILPSTEVCEPGPGCEIAFLMACDTGSPDACCPSNRTVHVQGQRMGDGGSGGEADPLLLQHCLALHNSVGGLDLHSLQPAAGKGTAAGSLEGCSLNRL